MKDLLDAIFDLVANTPPERIGQLARDIEKYGFEAPKIAGWATNSGSRTRLTGVLKAARDPEITSSSLAGMLLGAAHAYAREKANEVVDLVLTGPSTPIVATRRTEAALVQVIDAARSSLFLTSFVAYDVAPILTSLQSAIDRNVTVSVLLESSDRHGGDVSFDVIGKMRSALPGAYIYFWKNKASNFQGGKVHAKVAVTDRRLAFISSANLTGHAMEKNIEAGVLIEGGDTPRRLQEHFESLVTTRVISEK